MCAWLACCSSRGRLRRLAKFSRFAYRTVAPRLVDGSGERSGFTVKTRLAAAIWCNDNPPAFDTFGRTRLRFVRSASQKCPLRARVRGTRGAVRGCGVHARRARRTRRVLRGCPRLHALAGRAVGFIVVLTTAGIIRITELSIRAGDACGRVRSRCAFRVALAARARGASLRLARGCIIAIRVLTRYAICAKSIVCGSGSLGVALTLLTFQYGLCLATGGVVGVVPRPRRADCARGANDVIGGSGSLGETLAFRTCHRACCVSPDRLILTRIYLINLPGAKDLVFVTESHAVWAPERLGKRRDGSNVPRVKTVPFKLFCTCKGVV